MPNGHDLDGLEQQFHRDIIHMYEAAIRECRYNAHEFIRMVSEDGALATTRRLLRAPHVQTGFTRLWECGRLDLSLEALILKPEYTDLFTDEERHIARNRLQEYNYYVG